jgi:hypothetical protein
MSFKNIERQTARWIHIACKSITLHQRTAKAGSIAMPIFFPDGHAEKSAHCQKVDVLAEVKQYELLQP